MSRVVSVRLPEEKVLQLKLLACKRSLEQQAEIRWPTLVRQAIDELLAGQESTPEERVEA